eukprot:TRINITY_DN6031_c0_g1_i2.p1 TRINITY_DN6031_c0_g1~~TRINITY_DN6031_c0_g1_i2.p1  ORF type:complete len:636 (-),score=139.50 TRINITY_DN6031_c0_g1_i2:338-2245(-)
MSATTSSTSDANRKIEELQFDNLALRALPLDPVVEEVPRSRQVRNACFSRVKPTPVKNPSVIAYSKPALELLGLDVDTESKRSEFAEYFGGNKIIPGCEPAAHCYCGHQFGHFSGQLGDGATMYLGEVINPKGERWEIQFKGAGKTPYSRNADGRKVLRSSVREFLCSEANHFLGIPTTRAGTVVTSDSRIARDIFYNGNVIMERCSIVLRIAPSFIRFGSFEICKPIDRETGREGPSHGLEHEILPKMLSYVIQTFYPDIWNKHPDGHDITEDRPATKEMYKDFYREVVRRTARLVADWQLFGFCHGVLNTDNMSILGLTIDYGPYGYLDAYDPNFICNGSDNSGRYAYSKQPEICKWNCLKLAEALSPVMSKAFGLSILEEEFDATFEAHYNQRMRNKLGLINKTFEDDKELFESFFETLEKTCADFTNCFRGLSKLSLTALTQGSNAESIQELLNYLLRQVASVDFQKRACRPSIPPDQLRMLLSIAEKDPRMLAMFGLDPDALVRDITKMKMLKQLETLTPEGKKEEDSKIWLEWLNKYCDRLRKEIEGLDVASIAELDVKRKQVMDSNNPKYILRNYIAQKAIEQAEKGDYSEVHKVLGMLMKPFEDNPQLDAEGYSSTPPNWASELCVT